MLLMSQTLIDTDDSPNTIISPPPNISFPLEDSDLIFFHRQTDSSQKKLCAYYPAAAAAAADASAVFG